MSNKDLDKKPIQGEEGGADPAALYNEAVQILESKSDKLALYRKARSILEQIPDYKSSQKLLDECNEKIIDLTLRADEAKRKKKKIIGIVIGVVVVIIIGILVMSYLDKQSGDNQKNLEKAFQYLEEAETLTGNKQANRYSQAYELLTSLGSYKNASYEIVKNKVDRVKKAADKEDYDGAFSLYGSLMSNPLYSNDELVIGAGTYVSELILSRAKEAYENKNYYDALALFRKLNVSNPEIIGYIDKCQFDAINGAKVGETVRFGTYQLTTDGADFNYDDDVSWIVAQKNGNKLLLVCEEVIEVQPFNTTVGEITWADSTLRAYLNGKLYETLFSDIEKNHIVETETESGVKDKLFLLSEEEAKTVLGDDLAAFGSEYARYKGWTVYNEDGNGSWWTRDTSGNTAVAFTFDGKTNESGYLVSLPSVGVRPAVWITAD